ncbi:unnamed protein product, partial [marine sediment metagenome]
PKIDLDTMKGIQEKKAAQLEEHGHKVNEAVSRVNIYDDFKYIKEKPGVLINNIENERKRIGKMLRKHGYSKEEIRDAISIVNQNASKDFINSEREKAFKFEGQDKVFERAEESAQPYIDGWKEGTFIDPETGMRSTRAETDEDQDYLDYRNEVLLNLTEQAGVKPEISEIESILEANKDVPFVDRIINYKKYPVREIGDEEYYKEESHKLEYAEADGKYYVYPTLVYRDEKWITPEDPFKDAKENKNVIVFDEEEEAEKFAAGSWKDWIAEQEEPEKANLMLRS